MNLIQVVIEANDINPIAVRIDHTVAGQIINGRAPQTGLFAAGVFADVAADGRTVGTGRIDGKHQTGRIGRLHHPTRNRAASRANHRRRIGTSRKGLFENGTDEIEFFRINHGA